MSKLKELFEKKRSGILNVYCTAGFPALNDTLRVMKSLQQNGADIIELGMPYSDPLADGPVIQASSAKALANGMSISVLFEQLEQMRPVIHIPVVLMGYLNPVIRYGFEKFCVHCKQVGIDGLIIPDIPLHEYQRDYQHIVDQYGLDFIFLVTPETSDERILEYDTAGSGFLYAVSSSGTTGKKKGSEHLHPYLSRLNSLNLSNPVLIGFGISDQEGFRQACSLADGAIIGSAYIQAIQHGDIEENTEKFLRGLKDNS